ncbi:HpcH/HpaI aldolase/citrate lyase family protein [uncultured Cardiobacterium sp.]|uniref:HpcH/HpaI aldolase/citrate lyase family protein n=1 Tax=uncultured Cardiobacterium sp. TaxID=417619 RepID=UPI002637444B|nr:HpcH/HpaI aldolase/citrate lyase family protein [uncultured Cardiobacterium sp.]
MNAHQLGACLYVPATHPQLVAIARGDKLSGVRSLIYCTEDSVAARDLPQALANLAAALAATPDDCPRHRFIRLRDADVMRQVLAMPHIGRIHGFVLPKITAASLGDYRALLDTAFRLMPTLETQETYRESEVLRLLDTFDRDGWRARILCLRIGGNDLLSQLHLRRPPDATLYASPLGTLIDRLVGLCKPAGYLLSAPVFEYLDRPDLLAQEVREDLRHGLTGKSAIHPAQVAVIEREYRVSQEERDLAQQILASEAAVFRAGGAMQETAVHRNWAQAIVQRARAFPAA